MPTKRDNAEEQLARIDQMVEEERDLRERREKADRDAAEARDHADDSSRVLAKKTQS